MTRKNPLVSVVIPNYNYEKYLGECINSVLNQSYRNFEIIVIDDGSTDSSLKLLLNYSDKIHLYRTPNFGAPSARNLAMLYAKGDLIAFLDADDKWLPEKLELQVSKLTANKLDLVYCKMDTDEESINTLKVKNQKIDLRWFHDNPGSTPFSPSATIITKSLAARVGGWNTSLTSPAEDFDYFRKCAKFGRMEMVNSVLVIHRNHEASLTATNKERYFEDNIRAVRLMLTEDRSMLKFVKRISIWNKIHIKFMKFAIKEGDLALLAHVFVSYVRA